MSEIPIETDFTGGLLAIAVLILLNGVMAMAETALLSVRKTRLQNQQNKGDHRASAVLKLADNPNQFLSVIQIGITTTDLLVGALTGATIGLWLNQQMNQYPALQPYSDIISLVIGVLPVTYLSLVLGELIPKRLALRDPEGVSMVVAPTMLFFSKIFSPLVRLLSFSTETGLRLLGVKPIEEQPVTEEEIQLLIDQGTQAGVFEEAEQDMVEGIFSLGDSRIYSLMTPRTEVIWLDIAETIEEVREKIANCPYSRFPVRDDSLENILGVVRARDLLVECLAGKAINLKDLLKPAHYIPETMFASRALELFKQENVELFLVVDEFGGLQGLLTINDILEEIVGAMDFEEPQATQRQDGSWLLDGMLEADEFKELFNFESLTHEDEYETLSGFMMTSLGRIPQAGDNFEWNGYRFEVLDMDGRRVDKVLVMKLPKAGD